MSIVHRVLPPDPVVDLADHIGQRGGEGLKASGAVDADTLIAEILASGLRGRGGAGFPTGKKWRTVRDNRSASLAATVVVNGAEGEPGTFKDRTILRSNPYLVIEGALIAARAVDASKVIFGLKASFGPELARVRKAIDEVREAGWADGIELEIFEGPDEYLYGEETALLETIDGRYPFPRTAPPFRRGVDEVVEAGTDTDDDSNSPSEVEMAGPDQNAAAPPTLVDNVETLANVPRIIARGAKWFRTHGTEESPGTIVCTVTGSTVRDGVGEVPMATTLREAIDLIGGGAREGRRITAVLPGVANALIPEAHLDTPLTYEDMAAIGSGLGSGGFMVFDDADDLTAVVAGVSRFLAVESCGQCTPCKQDGLALADLLAGLSRSASADGDVDLIRDRLATITDSARCSLAIQHQVVVTSLLDLFPHEVAGHGKGGDSGTDGVAPAVVAELIDIEGDVAVLDAHHAEKQPDWTYDEVDSGQSPADRLVEHRSPEPLPDA
jgi:NADH:ubiquinone oxidoreductase subunit F (NADH-binding)